MKIIHDGDHGCDDFITTLVMMAHPELFELLGIVSCHGNTSAEQAAKNAASALALAKIDHVPVFVGEKAPWKSDAKEGDNAFGGNGLGGLEFSHTLDLVQNADWVEWIVETLEKSSEPIHFVVTGPLTNMARLLSEYPNLKEKIASVLIMGGCIDTLPPDFTRTGNITEDAEFNFYMDANAADYVLQSGLDITLFPMNLTHQLEFSPDRQHTLRSYLPDKFGADIVALMRFVENLDMKTFKASGAYIHDVHTVLSLIDQGAYSYEEVSLCVLTDPHGKVTKGDHPNTIKVATHCDTDTAFKRLCTSLSIATSKSV